MKYISICSGIEAASVAWAPLSWEPVAFAEIEPFPSAVLAHHYPDVPNVGDITKVNWSEYHGEANVVIGGTPCQSFSLAGNRKGLDDPRGQLALAFVRLVEAIAPEWFIWENVPGVLSANGGRDFQEFCAALDGIGYHIAWRVLDAQHFGVPQRRRRIFLVGHIADWRRAAKVLFETNSLQGDIAKSGGERKGSAGRVESGVGKASILNDQGGSIMSVHEDYCPTLRAQTHGNNPIVFKNDVIPINTQALLRNFKKGDRVGFGIGENGDPANTLQAAHSHGVFSNNIIRRLTPLECERLQGFKDHYTRIPYRKKSAEDCPDSPRYKAIGNSMAVPVVRWIGARIQGVNNVTI